MRDTQNNRHSTVCKTNANANANNEYNCVPEIRLQSVTAERHHTDDDDDDSNGGNDLGTIFRLSTTTLWHSGPHSGIIYSAFRVRINLCWAAQSAKQHQPDQHGRQILLMNKHTCAQKQITQRHSGIKVLSDNFDDDDAVA